MRDAAPLPPLDLDLEDVVKRLEELASEWPKPCIQRGFDQGMAHERRLLRHLAATRFEDRVREWPKPYIRQGFEQAMAHERQLLRHLAATRFDAATADRLAAAIGDEADPQRLMEVGEAIVRCNTGSELLRKIDSRR